VREFFSDSQETFRSLYACRERLLKETNGLAALPVRQRVWDGHLFWLAKFAKIEIISALTRMSRIFVRAYCKTADRMFGGDRYRRYLQARRQEFEYHMAKACESESKARRLEQSHLTPASNTRRAETLALSHATKTPFNRPLTRGPFLFPDQRAALSSGTLRFAGVHRGRIWRCAGA
jgi:hypothetical protein